MKVEEIRNIGVIGAGLMGHGIAQVFALKGYKVKLLGPLETADLADLDLTYDIHQYLFSDLENRSTPSPLLKTLVDQKTIGVKAKKGFYHWTDESIKQIIQQRDKALLKITEVIKGLNREKKQ